jgi:hypothetical protein
MLLAPRIRPAPDYTGRFEPELACGAVTGGLLHATHLTFPGNQAAADDKQRSRVLAQ